jgi:hypothetical protein
MIATTVQACTASVVLDISCVTWWASAPLSLSGAAAGFAENYAEV